MKDSKARFSNRAEDYARYRPGYPQEVLTFLEECGVAGGSVVADVGSGTGILSGLFLEYGNRVFGVEPNREMREAAERILGSNPRFESVAGSAEATTLRDGSVDLVVAGNSFHWFDAEAARTEFPRILRPGGSVAVVWNVPRKTGTPFLEAHERLLSRHRKDGETAEVYENLHERTGAFFGVTGQRDYETASFPNSQALDFEGLKGLIFSYSNVPAKEGPGASEMLNDLVEVFRTNETGGWVTMEYETRVYCGSLR